MEKWSLAWNFGNHRSPMAKSYERVASQTTMPLTIPNWKSSHKGEDEWVGWRLDKSSRQRISGYRKSNVGRDKRVMSCGFIGPGIRTWTCIIIHFCLYLTSTVQRVVALEASYYLSDISISREEFKDGSRLPNSYEHFLSLSAWFPNYC